MHMMVMRGKVIFRATLDERAIPGIGRDVSLDHSGWQMSGLRRRSSTANAAHGIELVHGIMHRTVQSGGRRRSIGQAALLRPRRRHGLLQQLRPGRFHRAAAAA
jgi:hypothetical protein